MQEILGAIEQGARLPIARRAMPHITQCFFEVAQFFLAMGEAEEYVYIWQRAKDCGLGTLYRFADRFADQTYRNITQSFTTL